jgi:hypothetical protein
MSTDKEIYLIAMAQTGKPFSELDDDDLLAALGTDNAINRSKDDDPEEQEKLHNSVRSVQRNYGLLPDDGNEEEIDRTVRLLRRRAGLNEHAVPYRFRIKVRGRTIETVIWAENRIEAELLANAQYGTNSVVSAPKRS